MDFSKLKYTKEPLKRKLKGVAKKDLIKKGQKKLTFSVKSQLYTKPDGVLSGNLVFVLSGGERREKNFLKELIKQRFRSLRVAFMSKKGQGLHPFQMQDVWDNIRKDKVIKISNINYRLITIDKVFLLTDVDEFYNQLVEILNKKREDDNGHWIISNPCFEIWLYYCFLCNPKEDLAYLASLNVKDRSKELKKMGNTLVSGGLNPCKAFQYIKEGIKNSLQYFEKDENNIPKLFSTNMHEMAEYIYNILEQNKNEYSKFKENQDKIRMKMFKP